MARCPERSPGDFDICPTTGRLLLRTLSPHQPQLVEELAVTLKVRNFVDGDYRDAADGRTTPLIDPSTGEEYGIATLSGAQDVEAACAAAARAFGSWRNATPAERSRALLKLADAFEANGEEIVRLECQNTGKQI